VNILLTKTNPKINIAIARTITTNVPIDSSIAPLEFPLLNILELVVNVL
jgi:hypothetical protein